MSNDALVFFRDRFGLDDRSLSSALDTALERRIDHADLYFEYTVEDSVALEEGIVKSGSRHLEQGVGVRTQVAQRQGYAHSDEVTIEKLPAAIRVRYVASDGRARVQVFPKHDINDGDAMRRFDSECMKRGIYALPGVRRFFSTAHGEPELEDTLRILDEACRAVA